MKVILEIENDEDMQRVEKLLKFLQPTLIRNTLEKANKMKDFFDFVDKEAIHVQHIAIPNREERNAR